MRENKQLTISKIQKTIYKELGALTYREEKVLKRTVELMINKEDKK